MSAAGEACPAALSLAFVEVSLVTYVITSGWKGPPACTISERTVLVALAPLDTQGVSEPPPSPCKTPLPSPCRLPQTVDPDPVFEGLSPLPAHKKARKF